MNFILSFLPIIAFALFDGDPIKKEFPALVRLSFSNGQVCTGVFLDQKTILTAAHCLSDEVNLNSITDSLGKDVPIRAKKFFRHPLYEKDFWHENDIGIIKTTNYQFRKTYSPGAVSRKGEAELFGCGRNEKNEAHCLTGMNSYIRKGSSLILYSGRACVAPNDSGGPVLEKGKLIGIMTATYGNPCVSLGTSVVTEENLKFISEMLME